MSACDLVGNRLTVNYNAGRILVSAYDRRNLLVRAIVDMDGNATDTGAGGVGIPGTPTAIAP